MRGEGAVTDSQALRRFVGIGLLQESAPDAMLLLKCRHLLVKDESSKKGVGGDKRQGDCPGINDAGRHDRRRHDIDGTSVGQE